MSMADFVAAWRSRVGEPPAVMLDSRAEMIGILAEAMVASAGSADEQALKLAQPDINKYCAVNGVGKPYPGCDL